eukprot:CAMPEP_0177517006 /NCGR_PEP_ID=MMETSP0369-20130122/45731_1 /TAXON_ID=447022 ORGANISM="Scrippsiella hangoei-like, Strain SHHI-4" /NCGR_SAMPLE_ID=MMETSP0369 /ASSEMBLY_ACC=CAM_ASM_000364 /LENGTH=47 /DNA_ID= /DNA_START= /DNA_END= /DNA_ORIENTATION=
MVAASAAAAVAAAAKLNGPMGMAGFFTDRPALHGVSTRGRLPPSKSA